MSTSVIWRIINVMSYSDCAIKITRKCIYCLEEKLVSEFDTEHVINKAFGTYDADTPTLDCVCHDCNHTLGTTIDLHLARGTFEGMERIRRIVRKPEPKQIAQARKLLAEILLVMPGHPLHEILMVPNLSEDGEVKVIPVPQIGFRRTDTKKWINFALEEFVANGKPDLPKCDKVRLYGIENELEILRNKVSEYELPVRGDLEMVPSPSDEVWVDIHWHIKEYVRRSIAKIALNYAAFTHGSDFVLQPVFDAVRQFIRYDKGHCLDFVQVSPIRLTETEGFEECHFVGLEMKPNCSLIAYVSLFNSFTYYVRLVRTYPIWHRLSHGHFFDPINNTSGELLVTSLRVPPWISKQNEPAPLIRKVTD